MNPTTPPAYRPGSRYEVRDDEAEVNTCTDHAVKVSTAMQVQAPL